MTRSELLPVVANAKKIGLLAEQMPATAAQHEMPEFESDDRSSTDRAHESFAPPGFEAPALPEYAVEPEPAASPSSRPNLKLLAKPSPRTNPSPPTNRKLAAKTSPRTNPKPLRQTRSPKPGPSPSSGPSPSRSRRPSRAVNGPAATLRNRIVNLVEVALEEAAGSEIERLDAELEAERTARGDLELLRDEERGARESMAQALEGAGDRIETLEPELEQANQRVEALEAELEQARQRVEALEPLEPELAQAKERIEALEPLEPELAQAKRAGRDAGARARAGQASESRRWSRSSRSSRRPSSGLRRWSPSSRS